MKERLMDKIKDIEVYVIELEDIIPLDFETYISDNVKMAACERYFERIVEACVDLASLMIRYKKINIPEDDEKAFYVFSNNNIISINLAAKLREAKGMRNIIAHEYGKIDDELVFNSLKEELVRDVQELLNVIKNKI